MSIFQDPRQKKQEVKYVRARGHDLAWYLSVVGGLLALMSFLGFGSYKSFYSHDTTAPEDNLGAEIFHQKATVNQGQTTEESALHSENHSPEHAQLPRPSTFERLIQGGWDNKNWLYRTWLQADIHFYADGKIKILYPMLSNPSLIFCEGSYTFTEYNQVHIKCPPCGEADWLIQFENDEMSVAVKEGFGREGVYQRY